jgi:hypothetical protein
MTDTRKITAKIYLFINKEAGPDISSPAILPIIL